MIVNVKFEESTSEIPVRFDDLQIITNGVPPEEVEKLVEAAEEKGIDIGKQAEYDRFWDAFQQNGERGNYVYAFYEWPQEALKPKYNVIPAQATTMFGSIDWPLSIPDIEKEYGIKFDFSRCTNLTGLATYSDVKDLGFVDTTACASLTTTFAHAYGLERVSIKLREDGSQIFTSTFNGSYSLIDVTITDGVIGNSVSFPIASKISNDSVQSVIDHLKDLTGLTAQTLTFHADVGARLTEAQKATITAKNWTLVY